MAAAEFVRIGADRSPVGRSLVVTRWWS